MLPEENPSRQKCSLSVGMVDINIIYNSEQKRLVGVLPHTLHYGPLCCSKVDTSLKLGIASDLSFSG